MLPLNTANMEPMSQKNRFAYPLKYTDEVKKNIRVNARVTIVALNSVVATYGLECVPSLVLFHGIAKSVIKDAKPNSWVSR